MTDTIQVENLTHHYGPHKAVDNVTFSARHGEVLGLLGPNGAGKTTTIRLLNGLFSPTSGSIRVLGMDPVTHGKQVRMQTGVLTETPALYERLTARENLHFFGSLSSMTTAEVNARTDEMLAFFDLTGRANSRVDTFSKGMKQRLALARAVLTRPQLLFLDEPTAGLDPEAAQQVHELIDGMGRRQGQTVLLCTHNLFEAERLCDRLAILNHGRLLAIGTLDELRSRIFPGWWLQIELQNELDAAQLRAACENLPGVEQAVPARPAGACSSIRLRLTDAASTPDVIQALSSAGMRLMAVLPQRATLEEIYFHLQAQDAAINNSAHNGVNGGAK